MDKSQSADSFPEKNLSAEEDLKKIETCLQGDWSSFEFLYEKYKEKVYRIAFRYVQRREDSLDIVQEVFAKIYTSLNKFERRSSFYTWLCRITINKSIDYIRLKKNTVSYESYMTQDSQEGPSLSQNLSPYKEISGQEFQKAFEKALEELPDIHKSVFVLYSLEELSYKEIAEVLDCSIGTIMSRLHYARKKLQNLLQHLLPSPGEIAESSEEEEAENSKK
jgi:RNA polymerase sigma-70 factor (ECF subfamily)